ncbi:MAG: ATP-binding protein [Lachnospiraceae bacterium]|nr:ATP-binding protein [Lachnospiraceae bacterium]
MPGTILGIYGQQRSGKTLMAYKLTKTLQQQAKAQGEPIRVYTNLYCPKDEGFVFVNSIDELPLDLEPKIVLIDEIYNGCDAQDYRKLKDISIFINTLGKQNCLFVFTSIDATMVYNRIRNQMKMVILVKGAAQHIHYKLLNMSNGKASDYVVEKNAKLFEDVNYDTDFIPLDFNWEMKSWRSRLQEFYKEHYGLNVTV